METLKGAVESAKSMAGYGVSLNKAQHELATASGQQVT